ncbi:MAG TPA: NADP-dependent oxidoreductase [Conexibacter sp.]|nr:NADP-dependent oxidoreductase [Conexibacter sp.]
MTATAEDTLMRAISPSAWGSADLLREIETARPTPGPTEILVRVHAAGVNATDWKQREAGGLGLWGDPPILGYDVSGVVEEVGMGVTHLQPGDAVFGMPRFPHQGGTYAEYLAAPSRQFARKPEGIDHVHAAALPLVGLTAWQALVETADVQPGQRVLIHAAAGGLGHVAVQVAKARGAYVIGTARAEKHDFVRGVGADEVVDYTAVDFAETVRDIDVAFDSIGGEYAARSLRTLRDGGVLISLASPFEPGEDVEADAAAREIQTGFTLVEADGAGMQAIAGLVEAGKLRVEVTTVLPLAQAAEAHRLGETGRTTGKIVLEVVS